MFDAMLELRGQVREPRRACSARQPSRRARQARPRTAATSSCAASTSARDEIVTTDDEHFGLLGALHASGARARRPVREPAGRERSTRSRPRSRPHAADRAVARDWDNGHRLPVASSRGPGCRCSSTARSRSARSRSTSARARLLHRLRQKWLCGPDRPARSTSRSGASLECPCSDLLRPAGLRARRRFAPAGAARFDPDWIPPRSPGCRPRSTASAAAVRAGAADGDACRELLRQRFEVVTEPAQATLVSFRPRDDPGTRCASTSRA